MRFIVNLLPQLQNATSLRRVITVAAGGFEGEIFVDDLMGRNIPLRATRGHFCSVMSLALEAISKKAPNVSFIHNYPGSINTNLIRGNEGFFLQLVKLYFKIRLLFKSMPLKECGERHALLCTSLKYPPLKDGATASGASLTAAISVAKGIDGKTGSGVYSVDHEGESASTAVVDLLAKYRQQGMVDKVWKHTEDEFLKITG